MMKFTLQMALFTTSIFASETSGPTYSSMSMISMILFLVVLFLLYLIFYHYKEKLQVRDTLLKEKEEKIRWLRQVGAENEHKHTKEQHETEKVILELKHTIENLETKLKEGTKNQVVAKLEAQQSKRARQMERAGLTD